MDDNRKMLRHFWPLLHTGRRKLFATLPQGLHLFEGHTMCAHRWSWFGTWIAVM